MTTKLFALILTGAALLAVGFFRTASKVQEPDPTIKDRLRWYAKEAKNHGRQKVTIPADIVEYLGSAGTITLDEATSSSTVVVAHLVSKQSFRQGDDGLLTWNRFAIDEIISEAKDLRCPACVPLSPPADIAPLQSGEFLLPKNGGSLRIDGIEIEQVDDSFPEFDQNKAYLLLIQLYPSGVARTLGGPVGVFNIDSKGQALPVSESDHRVRKDFKEKYGNSLDSLRKSIKKGRP